VTCRDHDGLSVSDRDYPRVLLPSGTQRARPDPRIKRKTRPSSKPSSPSVLLAPPHSSCSTWCGEVRCCVMALLLALLLLGTAADMPTVYKLAAAPASMAAELRSGRVCRRRAGGLFRWVCEPCGLRINGARWLTVTVPLPGHLPSARLARPLRIAGVGGLPVPLGPC